MSNTTPLLHPDENGHRADPGPWVTAGTAVVMPVRPHVSVGADADWDAGRGPDLGTRDGFPLDPPMTQIVVEYEPAARQKIERHIHHVVSKFGGTYVDDSATTEGQRIRVSFRHVCDATHAASTIIQLLDVLPAQAESDVAGAVRIVLCSAPRYGSTENGVDEINADQVAALLRQAGGPQVLMTGETAAIAGPTLPAGVELVDLGITRIGGNRTSRLYELRIRDHEQVDGMSPTASNLDWARRLASRHLSLADGDRAVVIGRWRGALDGVGTIAVLTSPDGQVASAAAAELALRAHADGAVVIHGSWDFAAPRPYGAFRQALGVYAAECSLARVRADLDRRGWDVARLLPELGARLGSPPAPPGPPHDEGCRVGDALSDWFRAIAGRDDLLLVLDNAQWADRASLHLCEQLSNDLADHRVLVVLCGAEREMRANGLLDAAIALTSSADGDEHWIALEGS
jgi:hypothetical protein